MKRKEKEQEKEDKKNVINKIVYIFQKREDKKPLQQELGGKRGEEELKPHQNYLKVINTQWTLLVNPVSKCRLKLLRMERTKDYLLMEEEFIKN